MSVSAAPLRHDLNDIIDRFNLPRVSVTIRPLQEEDNRSLEWQGGPDLRRFYENQWRAHSYGEAFVLIADFNGYPIGQAAIYWEGKPVHPAIPDVQSLRVHPAFQGQGIGTRLLSAAEVIAKQRGLPQLGLSVGRENKGAHRLYERCGFRVLNEEYEASWEYVNALGETVKVDDVIIDMVKDIQG